MCNSAQAAPVSTTAATQTTAPPVPSPQALGSRPVGASSSACAQALSSSLSAGLHLFGQAGDAAAALFGPCTAPSDVTASLAQGSGRAAAVHAASVSTRQQAERLAAEMGVSLRNGGTDDGEEVPVSEPGTPCNPIDLCNSE